MESTATYLNEWFQFCRISREELFIESQSRVDLHRAARLGAKIVRYLIMESQAQCSAESAVRALNVVDKYHRDAGFSRPCRHNRELRLKLVQMSGEFQIIPEQLACKEWVAGLCLCIGVRM